MILFIDYTNLKGLMYTAIMMGETYLYVFS